jgi:GNAT superfamily N-acetyltransferase
MNLTEVPNALTAEIYGFLRKKVHFQEYPVSDVAAALKNTLFSIVVYDGRRPVGIARVVGDGRIVFFIKDVVVDPEYQNKQIGQKLMKALLQYIDEKACPNAYVGLMCTPGTEGFYDKFGFIRRPCEGMGHGMVKFVHTNQGL